MAQALGEYYKSHTIWQRKVVNSPSLVYCTSAYGFFIQIFVSNDFSSKFFGQENCPFGDVCFIRFFVIVSHCIQLEFILIFFFNYLMYVVTFQTFSNFNILILYIKKSYYLTLISSKYLCKIFEDYVSIGAKTSIKHAIRRSF